MNVLRHSQLRSILESWDPWYLGEAVYVHESLNPGHWLICEQFIDELAESEGAKAPRPATQVPHTIADWLGRNSAELQEAIRSMCSWYHRSSLTIAYLSDVSGTASLANSGRLKFRCGTSNTSVQVVPVSIVRHLWAWTTHDQDCWASWEWAWWEHGPEDRQRARDVSCVRQDRGIVRSNIGQLCPGPGRHRTIGRTKCHMYW
ncbi:hypothetical protein PISMIDRAFT_276442 [Pisolithus microcarpus 441]|uniref:Uncharacterized protein n=1 Tax=Pisolithus microcarpus 441 TaxID=765257 RepID=A0A0C9YQT5_9AGAM|nr:hypothetical protein BKA83DRAFT_276442 [Pisolithus microcarpus]KIK16179.1 hypothetical protein PISMIDRAFT_276442 [Pisolithus microcarpus 441]